MYKQNVQVSMNSILRHGSCFKNVRMYNTTDTGTVSMTSSCHDSFSLSEYRKKSIKNLQSYDKNSTNMSNIRSSVRQSDASELLWTESKTDSDVTSSYSWVVSPHNHDVVMALRNKECFETWEYIKAKLLHRSSRCIYELRLILLE